MYVPEDIQTDRVHSKSLAKLDTLIPIWPWDSWVVKFCCFDDEWLTVQEEGLVAGSKCSFNLLG
jgi:hypothetical protein